MPFQDSFLQMAGGNVVLSQSGNAGAPLLRAREMLRRDGELTLDQFRELDELLRMMSHSHFAVLIDDPLHQARLRQYEVLSWRRSGLSVLIPVIMIAAGAILTFVIVAG